MFKIYSRIIGDENITDTIPLLVVNNIFSYYGNVLNMHKLYIYI